MFTREKNVFHTEEQVFLQRRGYKKKEFFSGKKRFHVICKKKDFCKKKVLTCKIKSGYVKKMREEKKNVKL